MNNQDKLFIVKQASGVVRAGMGRLERGIRNIIGSRGTTGVTRMVPPPNSQGWVQRDVANTLWGAKGLKGIFRPAFTQLQHPPVFPPTKPGQFPSNISWQQAGNNLIDTPLSNFLKVLGIGGMGGVVGYGMKKGLDADDAIDPTYSPKKKPNKNTASKLKNFNKL